jgi:hypothetical protein
MENIEKRPLDNSINQKINSLFNTKGNNYQITDKTFINKYELGEYTTKYKYYILPGLSEAVNSFLLDNKVYGIDYLEFTEKMKELDEKIFITSRTLQSLFLKNNDTSLHIACNSNIGHLNNFSFKNRYIYTSNIDKKTFNFKDTIYGTYTLKNKLKKPLKEMDFTVNELMFDLSNNVLIDKTNSGLHDIIEKRINIPVPENYYNEWIVNWKYTLDFFKLVLLGYKSSQNQENFIVNYINEHFNDIYVKPLKSGFPRFKKYVINDIFNGYLFTNNKYSYGDNTEEIISYLKLLEEKLSKDVFKSIICLIGNPTSISYNNNILNDTLCKYKFVFNYSIFNINGFEEKYRELIQDDIINIQNSYENVFKILEEETDELYVFGGTVRDIIDNKNINDIDILFNIDENRMQELCDENEWACPIIENKFKRIVFGEETGLTLEGHYDASFLFNQRDVDYDFTINRIVYDTINNLIIDLTGKGVYDLYNKFIRIPCPPSRYYIWAKSDWKRPLLYFKLRLKGYSPFNIDTKKFVIEYIETNFENIYMKKIAYAKNSNNKPVGPERIKHFLVKNLTNGTINEDGSFEYGNRKDLLVPYLDMLSKSLELRYMKKIMELLLVNN